VYQVRREHLEPGSALMDALDVVDREVQRLGSRRRRQPALCHVLDRDDDTVAFEVVTSARMTGALDTEELTVQLRRRFEVAHLERDTEQRRYCGHELGPFFTDRRPDDRQVSPAGGGLSSSNQ